METKIALLFSFISVAFGIFTGYAAMRRGHKKDIAKETAHLTTVLISLDHIRTDISDIKTDLSELKLDMKTDHERLVKAEESSKAVHRRLDSFTGISGKGMAI